TAMADQPHGQGQLISSSAVRGIDWRSTFPFTQIFRSFRIAIHPSKLILALLAMLLIFVGGWVMDGLTARTYRAVPDELAIYGESHAGVRPGELFETRRAEIRTALEADYNRRLAAINKPKGDLNALREDIARRRDDRVAQAHKNFM